MTIEQIKEEMGHRGWTNRFLADKLHIHEVTLSKILGGKANLTEQLASHIALLFESTRTAVFVYSVELPDEVCRDWVPGWEELSPKQQQQAVRAVVMQTLSRLKQVGVECLTDDERAAMAACCGFSALAGLDEIEEHVLTAAEPDDV